MSSVLEKVLSPAWYSQTLANTSKSMYNFYHPLFRKGSATPFWHMMIATSVIMYTTSYMARDYKRIKEKKANEVKAVHEFNEKYGIVDDHH